MSKSPSHKLNLGCGNDIREGWINLDSHALEGVDVVHDLNNLQLPFEDGQFTEILAQDVLEHLDYVPLMDELYRVLKPGGQLKIRVPHFTSRFNFMDPTHVKMFSHKTFDFFTKDSMYGREYYSKASFSRVEHVKIRFEKGIYFYNYLVEPLVNISRQSRTIYEASIFRGLFPAGMMEVILMK